MENRTGLRGKKGAARFRNPPAPIGSQEWNTWDPQLDGNHIARCIQSILPKLDLEPLRASYAGRGTPPYLPELMLAMVLVEKYEGSCSPSAWYRHQSDRISLLWIGQGIQVARGIWYQFRDRIAPYIDQWFGQILKLAQDAKITPATHAVIDGTLIAASASRHRLMNQKQLNSRLETLKEAIHCDEQQQSIPKVRQWMAKTPQGRLQQRDRYQRAMPFLQLRLDVNARKSPSERLDPDRVVISATDPEAALAPDKFKIFRPLYNSVLVTDRHSPLILGYDVYAHNMDAPYLMPMLDRTQKLVGHDVEQVTADSGFVTGRNLSLSKSRNVELIGPWKTNDYSRSKAGRFYDKDLFVWHPEAYEYECPAHQRLKRFGQETRRRSDQNEEKLERFKTEAGVCAACPLRTACTESRDGRQLRRGEHEDLIVAHRTKMAEPQAKAVLKSRGQIAERAFADIKEHRRLRSHTGRGLNRAKVDTGLSALVHNIVTVYRELKRRVATLAGDTENQKKK